MTCPECGGETKVSYTFKDIDVIARRRKCKECGHVFFTEECESPTAHQTYVLLEREYLERRK